MGAFHICCNFLGILGHRFGHAGLKDLLIETGLAAAGSIVGVLMGHHYNRAVRAHKLVHEALLRTKWSAFGSCLSENPQNAFDHQALLDLLDAVQDNISHDAFRELLESQHFAPMLAAYNKYTESSRGSMAEFWESYISLFELLLHFIRASRTGNWELHKTCLQQMLPWMFAYDHTNYARYMTIYLWDMLQLQMTHLDIEKSMKQGENAVQRCEGKAFCQIPVDQTIEQTVNRDSKTPGGIIGFSLNKSALQGWILTAHERPAVTQSCKRMAGLEDPEKGPHKESSKHRVQGDECVQQIVSVLTYLKNPFQPSNDLVSLTSGVVASDEITEDLLHAETKGQEALDDFVKLLLNSNKTNFFDPLKKLQLKTFSHAQKPKQRQETTKADFDFFARCLVIAQNRDLDLRQVFMYDLGYVPLSLASPDRDCKTTKAKLGHILERKAVTSLEKATGTVLIVDGMAFLHTLKQ